MRRSRSFWVTAGIACGIRIQPDRPKILVEFHRTLLPYVAIIQVVPHSQYHGDDASHDRKSKPNQARKRDAWLLRNRSVVSSCVALACSRNLFSITQSDSVRASLGYRELIFHL